MSKRITLCNITNILRALDGAGLLYTYNPPIYESSGNLKLVTSPNHCSGASCFSKDMFGNIMQYKGILKNSSYQAILKDGALIKVAYYFDKYEDLVRHNLWFWPNPFAISESDIEEHSPLDALDLYAADWEKHVRFRTPLRFDYDSERGSVDHSVSHLHMQTNECRIGIQKPICFANFIKFIFKNFYLAHWQLHDFWEQLPLDIEDIGNSLTNQEMAFMHLRWNKPLKN